MQHSHNKPICKLKGKATGFATALLCCALLGGCNSNPKDGESSSTSSGGNADYGKDAYGVPYAARHDGTLDRSLTPEDITDAVPRWEPITRAGNPGKYTVLGRNYRVMKSAKGYDEKGIASWYGRKFHGRKTANGEIYDMFAMTAAHKTLPIPSYVRVTNLSNNRTAIVRVNDRGPFAHKRIIDLSYAAAIKLDVFKTGTAKVRVTAIHVEEDGDYRDPGPATTVTPAAPPPAAPVSRLQMNSVYVQVASLGDRKVAEAQWSRLLDLRLPAEMKVSQVLGEDFYQIRIGPYPNLKEADEVLDRVRENGYPQSYIVADQNS